MSFGIAPRLALLLALFAIVVGGVTGAQIYLSARNLLADEARNRLMTTTQVLGQRIQTIAEGAERDVQRIADNTEVRDLLDRANRGHPLAHADDIAEQFEALLRVSPEYDQVRVISAAENGMERVRVDRGSDGGTVRVPEDDMQEKGHFDYVRETLALNGRVFASRISINQEQGAHAGSGKPTLRVAIAVPGQDGEPLGLVVINLSLASMLESLGDSLPADHELYLTDRRGEFLVHPDPDKAFAFDRGQSARVQDQFPATRVLFDGGPASVMETTSASHDGARDVVAAFARYQPQGHADNRFFVIGLAQSQDRVLSSARQLATAAAGIVGLFSVVAAFLAILLARAMTTPLRQMAEAVRNFPDRPLGTALPVARGDELGVLARGLHAMEASIRSHIGEVEAQRARLYHQAHHDILTGLPNRALFLDRMDQALARSRRTGTPIALLFVDLDEFKRVNDLHGHAAGDEVLKVVAERLRTGVREMDTAARIGGDEFVVVMEGTDDSDYLNAIAGKLAQMIAEPVPWRDGRVRVGASIGLACFPRDGDTIDDLTSCADARMYRAKEDARPAA